jgi:queuine tRNA-ribosyltransferase
MLTAHGEIETPVFMPVGTAGTVKAVHQRELAEDLNAQIILGNTYHLYLRPGIEIIKQAGGLHNFINWQRPILTDSGGYQVFSLSAMRKLTPEGALFSSHIDGSKHLFTPENIVEIQRAIGADIMMALDECTPYPSDHATAKKSIELTHQWLERGIRHFRATDPLYGKEQDFFPIVQGSVYRDLREISAREICKHDATGYAIGGLSVGEPEEVMYEMVEVVNGILPNDKPRYLMGVGTPVNLLEAISRGVDMFDCVMPTRNGRNGMLFTRNGIMNMRNNKWKDDYSSVDPEGTCFVDKQYSKAYLRHLIISKEILGAQIASLHNLSFYLWLMEESRKKIKEGSFGPWKNMMVKRLSERL